jgi:hypothetical protein
MTGYLGTGDTGGISGKILFENRTIQLWNKLPMNGSGNFPSNPSTFRKRVRNVVTEVK